MKQLFFISFLIVMLLPLTTSCEKDEVGQLSEKSGNKNGQDNPSGGDDYQDDFTTPIIVTVDANGNADGGHHFVNIDGESFYIDKIKYSVTDGNLIVTGYDKDTFAGRAKIISQLNYEGRELHVIGIGSGAFSESKNLTSITIPASITSIKGNPFAGCTGLAFIIVAEGNPTYDSRNNCNSVIETKSNNLIVGCKKTIIPSTVTGIGFAAFYGCTGLTSVTIPEGVTSIGHDAFSGCTGLISVTIPEGVSDIGAYAFQDCTSLTSVHIPLSVIYIGIQPFYGCTSLTSITVEDGSPTYDSRSNCNAIIETESNTLIIGCKNSTFPSSVTRIGDVAFYGCKTLATVTIPASITSIGFGAFMYCTGLTSVSIPLSVTDIGLLAFSGCTGLTSITVEDGNPTYDSRRNCNAIIETESNTLILGCKKTTIPSSVTSIGNSAFYHCLGLTSVTIPSSVTSIEDDAFWYCTDLTSVTIPSSVTSIGRWAFDSCTGLTHVYCYAGMVPRTKSDAFEDSNIANATLHVPASAINAYRNTAPWSGFWVIVAIQ